MEKATNDAITVYRSHELNIGIPAQRNSISFTFNLESFSGSEIEDFVNKLNREFKFTSIIRVPGHPLDLSLVAIAHVDENMEARLDEFLKRFKWTSTDIKLPVIDL